VLEQRIYSVNEVTSYIRALLEADTRLANLWVKGEISNFKCHSSGHLYFTLKDSSASIKCVMFRSRCERLQFRPEDGMEVVVRGYVSVYEIAGQYQLYVEEMDPSGLGGLFVAFEQLKAKLEAEGLFSADLKKPIPAIPSKIAVITSPTGAAVRDVLNVLNRRFPGINIFFVPAIVQGAEAPQSLVRALSLVNQHGEAQVILLVRGGGSIEDLWAFNTEAVARAIAASKIPVITGVGHETDYTIADFVADRRAPTPSAAAEIAVPSKKELSALVERYNRLLHTFVEKNLSERKARLERLRSSRIFQQPDALLVQYFQRVDFSERRLASAIAFIYSSCKSRLEAYAGKLEVLSPLKILARGFAICRKDNEVIRDSRVVETGDSVEVILRKGSLVCQVTKKRGDLAWKK